MKRLLVALLAWLACASAAGAHEITFSHVDVALNRDATVVRVQLPIKALLHEAPSPLPAGTTEQSLRAAPISADQSAALSALLARRLTLQAGGKAVALDIGGAMPAGDNVA
jgi:hypothetical protein